MREQNNQNNQQGSFIPCPLCKGNKKKGWAVCANCHNVYVKEATDLVIEGKTAPSKEEWLIQRLQSALLGLEEKSQEAKASLGNTRNLQDAHLNKLIADKTNGQSLHPDVMAEVRKRLVEERGEDTWKTVGGPTAFRTFKVAENRLREAKRLLEELIQKRQNGVAAAAQTPTMETHEPQ